MQFIDHKKGGVPDIRTQGYFGFMNICVPCVAPADLILYKPDAYRLLLNKNYSTNYTYKRQNDGYYRVFAPVWYMQYI